MNIRIGNQFAVHGWSRRLSHWVIWIYGSAISSQCMADPTDRLAELPSLTWSYGLVINLKYKADMQSHWGWGCMVVSCLSPDNHWPWPLPYDYNNCYEAMIKCVWRQLDKDPGHGSSVGEWMCISLSVLSVVRVQFPAVTEYFERFFPRRSHSANLSWASVAKNGSISLQCHDTTRPVDIEEEGWSPTMV